MAGRLRAALAAALCALLGAAAGRAVAARRRAGGADGIAIPGAALRPPGAHELAPGLVAAMRAGRWPWSFLRVPPWAAAFAVNFLVAAFARELRPIALAIGRAGRAAGFGEPPPAPPGD